MNKKHFIININNINLLIVHEDYYITNIDMVFNELDFINLEKETNESFINNITNQFENYFNGTLKEFTFKYKLIGTSFQKDVWNYLLKIPYSSLKTYEDIAISLGDKNKVRAVGNAVGKNPLIIFVPCHRIIRKDNSLGGFSSGIENKILLHKIEKIKI